MVDLGIMVLLMSIFGEKIAIVYVVVGLVIAVVGGTIIEKMHMEKYVEEFIRNWIPESWIQAVLGSNNPFGVILAVS